MLVIRVFDIGGPEPEQKQLLERKLSLLHECWSRVAGGVAVYDYEDRRCMNKVASVGSTYTKGRYFIRQTSDDDQYHDVLVHFL